MSSTYTSFAVAGAGALGSLVVSELLKQGAQVTVLTRGSNSEIPDGATTKVVDYSKPDELAAALKGIDVVVSAVAGAGIAVQPALADAAKAAGVKLFVPAEYGVVSHELKDGPLTFKSQLQAHLKSIGLPYTVYYTGLFADVPLFVFSGFDLATKTLANVGPDDVKFSVTTRPDIAHFVAYTLTHLPTSQLENARLGVEGSKEDFRDVAAILEKKYGGKFTTLNRDLAQVDKEVQEKGLAAVGDHVLWLFGKGYGDVGQNSNALVPGWTPLTYEQAVEKYYP
ncbi:NAD(P)-binding protein [Auricularia subglabra TFB-10046 SS5]|uniref:NAD(P)-binding protein n=1 Tax=Auricularia subglabra (strain TFB-10046 / SS5) TaxID=717982 RepID=J0WXG1_AURST|nr:NAD(P)-binding protein [Auricularia subglabra TFB-10046 SS5]